MPNLTRRGPSAPRRPARSALKQPLSPKAAGGLVLGLVLGVAVVALGHRALTTPSAPAPKEMPRVVQGEEIAVPTQPGTKVQEDPYVTEQRMNAINQALMQQKGE
jgi:hypothetical protein